MNESPAFLYGTAASIGLLHTLMGPDHYLPFIAMSRAGRWSLRKTLLVTLGCGLAHVLSSIILGLIGIILGLAVFKLETIEGLRASLAGWLLLAFGLVYFVWGVVRAVRHRPHVHWHSHAGGIVHCHEHVHVADHAHIHHAQDAGSSTSRSGSITPWVLFTIFIFGPCEALIPILMYPAAQGGWWSVALVALVFGLTTIITMTVAVYVSCCAVGSRVLGRYERYSHALAGLVILVCAGAMRMGL